MNTDISNTSETPTNQEHQNEPLPRKISTRILFVLCIIAISLSVITLGGLGFLFYHVPYWVKDIPQWITELPSDIQATPERVNKIENRINSINKRMFKTNEHINKVEKKVETLTDSFYDFSVGNAEIDLTNTSIQTIDSSFMISQLSADEHLSGVKVSGRIINTTSVDYTKLTFMITIASQIQEIDITRISSGRSTGFAVYVPNVPVYATDSATIQFVNAIVEYYK